MQFKVKDIGEEGVAVDVPVGESWLAQECPDLGLRLGEQGVRFTGRIERSGSDYLLRGRLAGDLVGPCSRCLEPATLPLRVDVSVIFVEADEEKVEEDDTLDAPDVLTFTEGVIDLTSELRDEILLAVPVSLLCREDCAGLCPTCGGNRNVNPCDCEEKERAKTSKFAALAKLKI